MYTPIINLLSNGEYELALKEIEQHKASGSVYDDTLAILEADACLGLGEAIRMFECLQAGLTYNYKNYELYYLLSQYYMYKNKHQAYLCLENAIFYCNDDSDAQFLRGQLQALAKEGYAVPPVSIIILSYNVKKEMLGCLDSIRQTVPPCAREIIVVDNASTDGITEELKKQPDIKLICNEHNEGFPKGCNQGIAIANPNNDIFLLNNDTIVMPNAIFWLRMGLYENDTIGATGSISNCISNGQQIAEQYDTIAEYEEFARTHNIPLLKPYIERTCLIGFAYMMKRSVLNQVGLLDERFSPGNLEDDDLSFRIIGKGYHLLLCLNSFIYHYGSKSFKKDPESFQKLLETNARKFKEKWGFDHTVFRL